MAAHQIQTPYSFFCRPINVAVMSAIQRSGIVMAVSAIRIIYAKEPLITGRLGSCSHTAANSFAPVLTVRSPGSFMQIQQNSDGCFLACLLFPDIYEQTIRKRFILRMRPVIFGIMHNSKTKLITQLINTEDLHAHEHEPY